jgi:plastocyanin
MACASRGRLGWFERSGRLMEGRRKRNLTGREPAFIAFAALGMSLLAGLAWGDSGPGHFQVSQRGRAFQPGELSIKRGDVVQIVNDDGDLLHHAYIESDAFNFDSGDQEPGGKVDVAFTVAGNFTVLCGIHPKMKLAVHVN